MKFRFRFLLIVIFLFVISACSNDTTESTNANESNTESAEDVSITSAGMDLPENIKERGKFIVGVKVDYPPLGFLDENGENAGFEIDIVKRLAKAAFNDENAVEYVPVTASNRIPYLTSEKIDFIAATIGITEDRKKEVDFSNPTFTSGVMSLVPKDSDIEDVEDLDGKQVISIKGTTGSIYLDENYPDTEQIKMDTTSDAVRALMDDRGVAFFGDAVLQFDIAKENPELKLVGKQVNMSSMAMALRKNDDELMEFINEQLEVLQQEDYFMELINEWLPNSENLFDDIEEMIPRPE